MKKWYGESMTKVVEMLGSDIRIGLNEDKIKNMRETYGENIILKPKIESLLILIINEIKQLWVIISLLLVAMLFYNKLDIMAAFVALIIIFSVMLLINGDYKEKKSLIAIDNLNTPFCNVKRSGKILKIGCEEIVVGDIVFLEKGSYIPADIRIVEYDDLKVVEVAVTGERYEVEKYSMKIEGEVINLSEIKNMLFKSSVVTEGSGLGVVIATGMNTQIGKIIKVLLEIKNDNGFFSKSLIGIANKVSRIIIIAEIITLVLALYKRIGIHDSINVLIYISMTFNLPVFIIIVFLFFDIIFAGFKKKNMSIKNISTIYSLTKISAILTKKIGVISENKFILREVYCNGILIDVKNKEFEVGHAIERIMSIALLCNDTKLRSDGTSYTRNPNSVESLAEYEIIKFCKGKVTSKSELEKNQRRIFKIPYDSDKRIKTVVNKTGNRYRANVKGVLDSLLNRCTHILISGVEKEIREDDIVNIINIHIDMSNKAYNVIGYGYRNFNYEPSIDENIESNLVFVGLMGFENPIKESSYVAMKICKKINIRTIIDEEDNKLASFAFGKLIGLTDTNEEILSGIEIDYMSKEEFEKKIESVSVFSKVSPRHKSEIVNSLNNKGFSIASVGDVLTDLEYLNNSDISISVGAECSNVVKKLSSVFLEKNDFSEIINLIQNSKKIVNYISKLVLFLSVISVSEVLIILVSLLNRGEMPFTFIGILYLNFIVGPCCGLLILLQNRNIDQNLKNIDYEYYKKRSIRNSLVIIVIYFLIITCINKFSILNVQDSGLFLFILYLNIFSLRFLYEKRFIKNKISYVLFLFNILAGCLYIFLKIKFL